MISPTCLKLVFYYEEELPLLSINIFISVRPQRFPFCLGIIMIYFHAQFVLYLASGILFKAPSVLFDIPNHSLSTYFLTRYLQPIIYLSWLSLGISHFSKESWLVFLTTQTVLIYLSRYICISNYRHRYIDISVEKQRTRWVTRSHIQPIDSSVSTIFSYIENIFIFIY